MKTMIWFVTDGIKVIGAFNDRIEAENEKNRYQDDPDFDYFDHYGVDVKDLEDYPDENDFAIQLGLISQS